MKRAAQMISMLALAGTVVPSILYFTGRLNLGRVKLVMLIATVVWFLATPLWMGRKPATQTSNPAEA